MNAFTPTLLSWFEQNRRELPWRDTTDPYAIWLSEVILQQTRIQQGLDYWLRFMRRWPTVEALAAATEDEVLREWQGLGYYSRARNLHAAARQIVALGRFPRTLDDIKALKGVGDYTAAAIGSIAFGLPVAVVDGNVYRVLARYFGVDTPINSTEGKKLFAQLAQSLLPDDQPSAFNQAMMDFGAIQCTPQSPACQSCPLADTCVAFREGRVGQLPVKLRKTKLQTRHLIYIYVRFEGRTALRRRPAGDIWQGLWEPLSLPDMTDGQPTDVTRALAAYGEVADSLTLLASQVRHVLTHRILLADFYLWQPHTKPTLPDDYVWMDCDDTNQYGVPRLIELLFSMVHNEER